MKLIIAGTRSLPQSQRQWVLDWLNRFRQVLTVTKVVSGCAAGVDTLGMEWAEANRLPILKFPADWDAYGKRAGPMRNGQMALCADMLIAFPARGSTGTQDMIRQMAALRKSLLVFPLPEVEQENIVIPPNKSAIERCDFS